MFLAASCVKEGPMGPAGADGTNGTNGVDGDAGTVTCLACHSGDKIDQKKAEFAMSEHSVGAVAVAYAGGRQACARCHSSQGFIEYATLGAVAGDISNPSAWECATCHGLHKTFEATDFALRLGSAPVASNIDASYSFDFKNNSNLCVNCHQARTAEPNIATPGAATFKIASPFYGPHHGPQGNVVAGVGFAEIPGTVTYPAPGSSKHFAAGACTACHMADFTNKQGGHSLIPSVAACNKCHNATDAEYDHGGVQTDVLAKLDQLRDKLVELGVVAHDTVADTYTVKVGTYPMVQAQAFYNWIGLEEDRSEGVHNPVYVRALLLNTLEALNK
ncbi:MAG: hypothetical protein ACYC5G_05945 [Candidatus Doudnabacteria bacterium]